MGRAINLKLHSANNVPLIRRRCCSIEPQISAARPIIFPGPCKPRLVRELVVHDVGVDFTGEDNAVGLATRLCRQRSY
ncbi:hypothetical protein JB92DRAFT_1463000 [Gautieria morchelliformis]|nr:hypothetical protein JB92DRAFT_1463000 [Gautieria morchelliformis]